MGKDTSDAEDEVQVLATQKPTLVKNRMHVQLGVDDPSGALFNTFSGYLYEKCTVHFRDATTGAELSRCEGPSVLDPAVVKHWPHTVAFRVTGIEHAKPSKLPIAFNFRGHKIPSSWNRICMNGSYFAVSRIKYQG